MSMRYPLPVAGYTAQSDATIALVNLNKQLEEQILRLLDELQGQADPRWLAIGRTCIEQGFMAVNRSIFRPERIKLPEDAA